MPIKSQNIFIRATTRSFRNMFEQQKMHYKIYMGYKKMQCCHFNLFLSDFCVFSPHLLCVGVYHSSQGIWISTFPTTCSPFKCTGTISYGYHPSDATHPLTCPLLHLWQLQDRTREPQVHVFHLQLFSVSFEED